MAARYAVGSGTWDGTSTTIWSATSGGATGASAPTSADDVFLDANSGAITIASGAVCRSRNDTGYTNTLTHTAAVTLTIGDSTAGAGNIALKQVAGATYTLGNATSSAITFQSTSGTTQTIDYAGKTTGNITFNAQGSWQYVSSHTTTGTITHSQGVLDTNSQACSWGVYSNNSSSLRTLTLGSSAITMTNSNTVWTFAGIAANNTITANTATITCTGTSVIFTVGGKDFNGTSLVFSGNGTASLNGGGTAANVTRTGTAAKLDGFNFNANFTVTNLLTLSGNSAVNRLLVSSNTLATSRTLTASNISITNADFMDITGAGTAAPFTGTSLGDCGGNSGITFTAAATQTWNGTSGGNWSTNAWSGRIPLPQDDVVINAAFAASQTVTVDMPRIGRNINWTGATGSPTWAFGVVSSLFGSLTMINAMTVGTTTNTVTFGGRGTHTITSNGTTFSPPITIAGPGGSYTLADAVMSGANNRLNVNNGTFDANGFNVTIDNFASSGSATRTINMGSGVWTITSSAAIVHWNIVATGLTFSGANATIVFATAGAATRTFTGGGQAYGTLTYTVAGSTGTLDVNGGNTFNTINFSDTTNARNIRFAPGTTTTVTNWNVNGTVGKLAGVFSTGTGTAFTINKLGGNISSDYLNISDSTVIGTTPAYAGANSTNSGNNTNWTFTAPPAAGPTVISTGRTSMIAYLGIGNLGRL